MVNHFNWLHLTDLHFGESDHKHLWPNIREVFFDDLSHLHERCGPWQAVVFTGDLVFSGQPQQFQEMEAEVLVRLWEKLKELGSSDPLLLSVPGNHDLARPPMNAALRQLIRKDGFEEIADEFWNNSNNEYRQVVTNAFSAYHNWWNATAFRPKAEFKHGILPGDFSATLKFGERRVGILGLNSTFLQLSGDDFSERLFLDNRQIQAACGDVVDWVEKHDACLLLTHHGRVWLSPNAQASYTEINPAGRFAVHLFGHMHEHQQESTSFGGGPLHRAWQTNSLFGMEKFGNPPRMDRRHGYAAGQIEFLGNDMRIRCWPRTASCDASNGWRLHANHTDAVLESDEGTAPELITLHRRKSKSANQLAPASNPSGSPAPVTESNRDSPEARGIFGRKALLEKISAGLQQTGLMMVYGMRGNGKSALVGEAARRLPLLGRQHLRFAADAELSASRLYQQLAHLLADPSEHPQAPLGTADEIIATLKGRCPNPPAFWIWIEHAHRLIENGRFRQAALATLLIALSRAWPGKVHLILELREQPPKGILGANTQYIEVPGMNKEALAEMLNGVDSTWGMTGEQLKRLFHWLGGGHGHLAHPHAAQLLVRVAQGHGETPLDTLQRHLGDYEREVAEVLVDDLYQNVLGEPEKNLIDTLSLYRNAIPHDHADRLERLMNCTGAWDGLCRRRLLAADMRGDEHFLHGFVADMLRQRLGYPPGTIEEDLLSEHPAKARSLHKHIASCWLADLGRSTRISPINVERALNALYHLCSAGEAKRLEQLTVDLFGGRQDWVIAQLDTLQRRLRESRVYKEQRLVLEYWSRVEPDNPMVWRFLGSAWRMSEGWGSPKARAAFREACRILPDHPEYWSNYGRASLAAGREASQEFLAEVEQSCPVAAQNNYVNAVVADALAVLGRDGEAMTLRQSWIDTDSADPVFYVDQAKAYLDQGKAGDALAVLDLARSRHRTNDFTESIRARALTALGRDGKARR